MRTKVFSAKRSIGFVAVLASVFVLAGMTGSAVARKVSTGSGTKTAPTSTAPQGVATTYYGLNAQTLFSLPADQWDAQLTKLAATGVGTVRFDALWSAVEPNPPTGGVAHQYKWSYTDRIVAALARHHLQALPIIDYGTTWASSNPTSPRAVYAPPDPNQYAAYARAFASRYGPGGAFWAVNPTLPALPIRQFEIWNEENGGTFFQGANPSTYATLYAGARAAIHSVVPDATAVVGGIVPQADGFNWLGSFISALPQHGAEIDAVGWHPYYPNTSGVYASLYWARRVLTSNGISPPIELTEVNDTDKSSQPAFLSELAKNLPGLDCHVTAMVVHTWTPLATDTPPELFAIADSSGQLNDSGKAFAASVQAAEASTPPSPAPVCGP